MLHAWICAGLLAATADDVLRGAEQALVDGDLPAAVELAEAALVALPPSTEIAQLLAALLHDVDRHRAGDLRRTAAPLVPLPTVPPERPASAGAAAFVNVASAAVRAAPDDTSKLLGRLPIGAKVQVQAFQGDFARVEATTGNARRGFVHRNLLAAEEPTIAGLLAASAAVADRDEALVFAWRALHLDPKRLYVLAAVIRGAFAARRYDVAIDAVRVALRAGAWPSPTGPATSPEALRRELYRAAQLRRGHLLAEHIAHLNRVVAYELDAGNVGLLSYYERALADPASELWRVLDLLLFRPPKKLGDRWWLESATWLIELSSAEGGAWRVSAFQLPGGVEPPGAHGGHFPWEAEIRRVTEEAELQRLREGPAPRLELRHVSGPSELARVLQQYGREIAPCLSGLGEGAQVGLEIVISSSQVAQAQLLRVHEPVRSRCVLSALRSARVPRSFRSAVVRLDALLTYVAEPPPPPQVKLAPELLPPNDCQGPLVLTGKQTVTLPPGIHCYERICVQDEARIGLTGPTNIVLSSAKTSVIGGRGIGPNDTQRTSLRIDTAEPAEIFVLADNASAAMDLMVNAPKAKLSVGLTGKTGLNISGAGASHMTTYSQWGLPAQFPFCSRGNDREPPPAFPPSVALPHTCAAGYGSSNYTRDVSDQSAELHVVGVYEGTQHVKGTVEVHVKDAKKPVVLLLSAYQTTRWRVTTAPYVRLQAVYVSGYQSQEVLGLSANVPLRTVSLGSYAYGWEPAANTGGGSYEAMIRRARQETGLTESSFQGCYAGKRFEIPYR